MTILDRWYIYEDEIAEEFIVVHYIGGEERDLLDNYYKAKEEAEKRRDFLNASGITGHWETREGDSQFYLDDNKHLLEA